jgi:hypothetical protein
MICSNIQKTQAIKIYAIFNCYTVFASYSPSVLVMTCSRISSPSKVSTECQLVKNSPKLTLDNP